MTAALSDELELATAKAERQHVVHVVLSLECGGLEHVVVDLARTGRDSGQQVSVICLERRGTLAEQLDEAGIPVYCLDKPAGLRISLMRRLLRPLLAKLQPDVLHSHQIGALLYAGSAARAIGVPVVVHTEHGNLFGDRARTRWLGRLAARYADRFFCVSREIAEDAIRFRITSRRKVLVMSNGIDTAKFSHGGDRSTVRQELQIPEEAPVIGTVGRLAEIKRQDLLIRAFGRLLHSVPSARLLLVGDGPLRASLEELTSELNLKNSVHFTGYRDDRERLLRAMDIFAITSRSEGMPLSVLEAWAAGVPVVAAHVGGLPELIDEGRTGILVPSDDPDVWSSTFCELVHAPENARRLSEQARRQCEQHHSLRSMLESYGAQYAEALRSRGQGRL